MMTNSKHDATEVFDPDPVLLEVEEFPHLPIKLDDEHWNPAIPLDVEEGEDIDAEV